MLVIALVLLLCGWLQPLHFLPWVSWHSELFTFLGVGVLAISALWGSISSSSGLIIKIPSFAFIFLALALLAATQKYFGMITFAGDVFVFFLYMALCFVSATLGFAAGSHEKRKFLLSYSALEIVAALTLVAAFFSSIIAIAQTFEIWEEMSWINRMVSLRRPGGNIAQPNQLATLILMGISSLLFLYESNRVKMALGVILLFILGAAVAMTESRTGILSLLLLTSWWFFKSRGIDFKSSGWTIFCVVASILCLFWLWPAIFDLVMQTSGGSKLNTSSGGRLLVWRQLLDAVAMRPWLGWGLNQVPEAQNAVAHLYAVSAPFSYSHNILIDLALGVGVPMTGLSILVVGYWFWRRAKHSNQLRPWYCIALVLPVAVHSMLEFPFAYAYFLVPTIFVLGMNESYSGNKRVFCIDSRFAAVLFLIIGAAGFLSVLDYIKVEEDFRIARFEALRLGQTPVEYERPKIILLNQLDALLAGARIVPKPGMGADELDLARKVALRYPWTATQNRYALSLALNGFPDEAARQLRVIRALHGIQAYTKIADNWNALADSKYPQLRSFKMPTDAVDAEKKDGKI